MTDFEKSTPDAPSPRPREPVEDPVEQSHLASLRQINEPGSVLLTLLPELRLMMGLVTAAIIIAALYFGRDILIPLALAIFLGFVLDPLVVRLKRLGLPRMPAVAVVAVATLVLIGLTGLFLANQVSTLSARLPTYQNNIVDKLRDLREDADKPGMFDGVSKTFETLRREINLPVTPPAPVADSTRPGAQNLTPRRVVIEETPPSAFETATEWLRLGSGPLATAGIVMVFVVLILLDRLDLRDRMLRLWGGSLHRSTDAMD